VLPPSTTQSELFEATSLPALIRRTLSGFNLTAMAYGQTGSGKTHTMEGPPGDAGVTPRVVAGLFAEIARAKEVGELSRAEVTCSFVQLYNEQLLDLLSNSDDAVRAAGDNRTGSLGKGRGFQQGLPVRWSKRKGFYAQGLSHFPVASAAEAMGLFRNGIQRRVVAGHDMNAASSRSHIMFTLDLRAVPGSVGGGPGGVEGDEEAEAAAEEEDEDEDDEEKEVGLASRVVESRITLVDLAGSERQSKTGASGTVLDESISINKSLFVLRKTIKALAARSQGRTDVSVPYRDSKLTSLLSPSLGGNSITLMIACVNSSDAYIEDSYSTLSYAALASTIVNDPRINLDPQSRMIAELKDEVGDDH